MQVQTRAGTIRMLYTYIYVYIYILEEGPPSCLCGLCVYLTQEIALDLHKPVTQARVMGGQHRYLDLTKGFV